MSRPLSSDLLTMFSFAERQRIVSGDERVSPDAFAALLFPEFDDDDDDENNDGGGLGDASLSSLSTSPSTLESSGASRKRKKNSSSSSSSSSSGGSGGSSSGGSSHARRNWAAFLRVVRQERFAPYLPKLLRFVCCCDAILPGTKITVKFDAALPVGACPEARTCVSTLILPAAATYGSDRDLMDKLQKCAENSTGFGFK